MVVSDTGVLTKASGKRYAAPQWADGFNAGSLSVTSVAADGTVTLNDGKQLQNPVDAVTLANMSFRGCDLSGTDFTGSNIGFADFSEVTSFVGAKFANVVASGSETFPAGYNWISVAHGQTLVRTLAGPNLDLSTAQFVGSGWSADAPALNQTDLAGIDFTGVTLPPGWLWTTNHTGGHVVLGPDRLTTVTAAGWTSPPGT